VKTAKSTKELSILLPAYNEAAQIEKCIRTVEAALQTFSDSYEIIVSEDGSTDGTDIIAAKMAQSKPNLVLLHSTNRLGKGRGIKNALKASSGKYIAFMDVDLATDLACLPELLRVVKANGGMAIGSRHVAGSSVQRHLTRTLSSLVYNALVGVLFMDGIHDHQCGFKMMTREVAETVLRCSKTDGYFFDTEMIVRCKKLGYPIKEVPVSWAEKNKGGSKVSPMRDGKKIAVEMLRFRLSPE
jgi:glycosyltransferase AglD